MTFEFRPPFFVYSSSSHPPIPSPNFLLFAYLRDLWRIFLKACSLGSLCLNPIWSQALSWNPSDHDLVLKGRETSRRMGGPPNKKINIFIPFLFSDSPEEDFIIDFYSLMTSFSINTYIIRIHRTEFKVATPLCDEGY